MENHRGLYRVLVSPLEVALLKRLRAAWLKRNRTVDREENWTLWEDIVSHSVGVFGRPRLVTRVKGCIAADLRDDMLLSALAKLRFIPWVGKAVEAGLQKLEDFYSMELIDDAVRFLDRSGLPQASMPRADRADLEKLVSTLARRGGAKAMRLIRPAVKCFAAEVMRRLVPFTGARL